MVELLKKIIGTIVLASTFLITPVTKAQDSKEHFFAKLPIISMAKNPINTKINNFILQDFSKDFAKKSYIEKGLRKSFYSIHPRIGEVFFTQTKRIYGLGALDSFFKGNRQSFNQDVSGFWGAKKGFGRIFWGVQFGSALEYGLTRGNTFLEKVRYTLGQAAISSLGEHLSYWMHAQLSGVPIKNWRGERRVFNLENGPRYPQDPINWMSESPAGWLAKIKGRKDVLKEDILGATALAYLFSYIITPTPDKPQESAGDLFNFSPYLHFDGSPSKFNQGVPYLNELKLGLSYKIPGEENYIYLYQNPNQHPILEFEFNGPDTRISTSFGIKGNENKTTPFMERISLERRLYKSFFLTVDTLPRKREAYLGLAIDLNRP